MVKLKAVLICMLLLSTAAASAQDATPEVTPEATAAATSAASTLPDRVVITHEGLFPEGVEWDSVNQRFLVSSVAEGTVYAVGDDGTATPLVEDERIPSSVGLEVDEERNRLLVVATDMERKGFLGIYDLSTGANQAFIDFRPLTPTDPEHFTNDVAVDSAGNAYVTDSFAGVIYRVDAQNQASIFLSDESFSTDLALNGIAYNEAGDYLIAVRVPDLIKIPLANPAGFTVVQLDKPLIHADGIVFTDDDTLAVVTNNPGNVYQLQSDDQFASAQIAATFETGNVFPTTAANRDGEVYVLYAQLNAEEQSVAEFPIVRAAFAELP